jgi:hypothetical protein
VRPPSAADSAPSVVDIHPQVHCTANTAMAGSGASDGSLLAEPVAGVVGCAAGAEAGTAGEAEVEHTLPEFAGAEEADTRAVHTEAERTIAAAAALGMLEAVEVGIPGAVAGWPAGVVERRSSVTDRMEGAHHTGPSDPDPAGWEEEH